MDDILSHLNKKTRDFGLYKRRALNDKQFDFDKHVDVDYLTRIDQDAFMGLTTYNHNDEQFELNIIYSQNQLDQLADNLKLLDADFSDFLKKTANSPYSNYEEIKFPDDKSMSMLISGKLALDMEDDFKTMGEDFLPFRVTEIQSCSIKN